VTEGVGAPESLDGSCQGSALDGRSTRRDQQLAGAFGAFGAFGVAGLEGEVGSEIPPRSVEPGVCGVDRLQGCAGQLRPPRRQQSLEDCLAGESVAEGEHPIVDPQKVLVHAALERLQDDIRRLVGRVMKKLPVELAAEDRSGRQDVTFFVAEVDEPGTHGLAERGRHAGRGQHLFDEERDPVGGALHAGNDLVVGVRYARSHHLGHAGGIEALHREMQRAAGSHEPPDHFAGRARLVAPGSDHKEDRDRDQVVCQVLDDGQGVRIGPVQILQHQHESARSTQPTQELDDRLGSDR
jgi:hypothetical protein